MLSFFPPTPPEISKNSEQFSFSKKFDILRVFLRVLPGPLLFLRANFPSDPDLPTYTKAPAAADRFRPLSAGVVF